MTEGNKLNKKQDANGKSGTSKPVRLVVLFYAIFCSNTYMNTLIVSQEFEVGAWISCKSTFDSQFHPAEVIERRQESDKGWSYYVHYAECTMIIILILPFDRLANPTNPLKNEL